MALPFFLWLLCVGTEHVRSHSGFSDIRTAPLAFAGGGFGSSPAKKTRTKPNKRKRTGGLTDLEPPVTKKTEEAPQLDKWGLPPPTEDDIFPPMPPGTELISVPQTGTTSLEDIVAALTDHIPLKLDNFDSDGVEQSPSPGNPPMKLKLLHKSPPVLNIENFFTKEECEVTKAVTMLDAVQVNSATFSALAQSKRTSTSWFCYYAQMPALVAKAHCRLGIPVPQMEEPQIVRYRTGEEFTWHYDEVPPTQLDNGGQRLVTLLVYLNTVKQGGGTIFRDLCNANGQPLTVKPVQGSALLFFPAFADGRPDDRTLHKGEVAHDEKWITQMWIHERAYGPVIPPNNTHEAAQSAVDQVSKKLGYQ